MKNLLLIGLFFLSLCSFSQSDKEYFELSVQNYNDLNYKTALENVERAILLKPGMLEYMEMKGKCLFYLDELQGAYDVMSFVLDSDSTRYVPYECISNIFDMTGEYRMAESYITAGLPYVPNDSVKAIFYCNRGATLSRYRKFDQAYEDLIKAHDLNPKDIFVLTNLGAICDEVGKGEETLKYLNLILDIDSTFYPAYVNIGFKYQELEEYAKAISYFDQALHIQPKDAYALNNRSYNKMKLGDLKGALKDVNLSIEFLSNNSYAYRNRALIYLEKNKTEKVCENLQLALDNGFTDQYGLEVQELQNKYCK